MKGRGVEVNSDPRGLPPMTSSYPRKNITKHYIVLTMGKGFRAITTTIAALAITVYDVIKTSSPSILREDVLGIGIRRSLLIGI